MSPQLKNWKNSLKSLYRLPDIYAPIPVLRQKIGIAPKEFTKPYGETSKMCAQWWGVGGLRSSPAQNAQFSVLFTYYA